MKNLITRLILSAKQPAVSPDYDPPCERLECSVCGRSSDLMLCNGRLTCRACTIMHIHQLQESTVPKLPAPKKGGRHAN